MHFDNKLYDIDKLFGDEFNIKPIDLMSFARQVSMGMVRNKFIFYYNIILI